MSAEETLSALNGVLVDNVNLDAALLELAELRDAALEERDHARDIACTLEQELAAAEAESLGFQLSIARVLDLLDGVLTLQPADPDTGDRNVSLFALMEALDGEPS